MSKTVGHIFGGEGKVKIMRLFVFNPKQYFLSREVAKRTKERPVKVRKDLINLTKGGLLKNGAKGYVLNSAYPYLPALENFLIDAAPVANKEIIKKISRVGNIKLILLAGVFLHDPEGRVDILVVGDHIKPGRLVSTISSIESVLGKELRYASFETADFRYRMGIYDKLIRDILEFPHQKIFNKLGI